MGFVFVSLWIFILEYRYWYFFIKSVEWMVDFLCFPNFSSSLLQFSIYFVTLCIRSKYRVLIIFCSLASVGLVLSGKMICSWNRLCALDMLLASMESGWRNSWYKDLCVPESSLWFLYLLLYMISKVTRVNKNLFSCSEGVCCDEVYILLVFLWCKT